MEYFTHSLPNGIQLIHRQTASEVAHCALYLNTGSRDEAAHESGYAHFVEHILFKGTTKRNSYHILSRMEDVGGELNAFTTKEESCIHASFLPQQLSRAMELMADMVFHHHIADKSVKSEKEVIIDEINSYKDNPSEQIFDDFDEWVFRNHPLGRNILGSRSSLRTINKEKLTQFIARNYATDQMVFSSIGDIPFKSVVKYALKFLGDIPAKSSPTERAPFSGYTPTRIEQRKNSHQVHCILGNICYDYHHPNRAGMLLLINLLGGPGMNTRLNLALRERNGFSYNIEASYTPYSDTGICSIYFSTDKERLERSLNIVHKELALIRQKPLGTLQLSKAKQQFIGQLAIASESLEHQMLAMGKSMLVFQKVEPIKEIYQKINAVTHSRIQDIAQEVFQEESFSRLIYK